MLQWQVVLILFRIFNLRPFWIEELTRGCGVGEITQHRYDDYCTSSPWLSLSLGGIQAEFGHEIVYSYRLLNFKMHMPF